jgi:hypothetical protein
MLTSYRRSHEFTEFKQYSDCTQKIADVIQGVDNTRKDALGHESTLRPMTIAQFTQLCNQWATVHSINFRVQILDFEKMPP